MYFSAKISKKSILKPLKAITKIKNNILSFYLIYFESWKKVISKWILKFNKWTSLYLIKAFKKLGKVLQETVFAPR